MLRASYGAFSFSNPVRSGFTGTNSKTGPPGVLTGLRRFWLPSRSFPVCPQIIGMPGSADG